MWARAVLVCGATPPESAMRKTNPISEEALSVKCQALSRTRRTGSPLGAPTSNFTLQTFGGTPTAEGESCETNPISAAGMKRQMLCGKGVMVNRTSDGPRQNKANCPKRGTEAVSRLRISDCGLRIADCGLSTDLWHGDRLCKTNPISPVGHGRGWSQSCETNPISAAAAVEKPHYSSIPSFQHSSPHTWDEGQMRKTNPIPPGGPLWHRHPADDPWAGWGPQTRFIAFGNPCPCHRIAEIGNCAKRTQFPGGAGRPSLGPPTPAASALAKPIVQNKANCPKRGTEAVSQLRVGDSLRRGDRLCKTNPILRLRIADSGRPAARRLGLRGPVVQTKPISRRGRTNIPRPPSGLGPRRVNCAKRSQLPETGHRGGVRSGPARWIWNPSPYAGRTLAEPTSKQGFDLSGAKGYLGAG